MTDARLAGAEYDGARAWLKAACKRPMEPIAADRIAARLEAVAVRMVVSLENGSPPE